MGSFSNAFLTRVTAFVVLGLFATATLTYAAEKRLTAANPVAAPAPAVQETVIVVPEVRGQAYVFAEGILEDNGFAWRVPGANGFAANNVVGQSPPAGTRVIDTGAPVVTLTLARNTAYAQAGSPVNAAPFVGTALKLADAVSAPVTPKAPVNAVPTAKAAAKKPVVAVPKFKAAARTPDFAVPGAPKEPSKEMPLAQRAQLLGTWLESHQTKSPANVQHWMYQHAWIVTGAKFGWWHGAEALKVLIKDDRRARALWGVGALNESIARAALAQVEARAKS